jgi:FecR protein
MDMKKTIFTILLILILLPVSIAAQSDPTAVLEYFEDPYGDMIITDETGRTLDFFDMGEVLPPGFSISTGAGVAEIRLNPNGTILKLAEDTDFSITNLQGYKGSPSNEFSLLAGKMRTIAARTSGINYYNVRTPTAVMGVRGTDFINEVGQAVSNVVVRQGLVEVIPFSGAPVMVSQNQTVNTLAGVMQAIELPLEQVNSLFRSMEFTALSPTDVPGHTPLPPGETAEESAEETEEKSTVAVPETAELTEADMEAAQSGSSRSDSKGDSKLAGILRDIFGMEIGTTTINGDTYSKVIIQPTINLGKFKLGLYLPVIYVDNLFDPSEYYKPQGNDEWSFGTDQSGNLQDVMLDILKDTMLKIKYVEYGDQGWDPFYLKIGNLNNMSIGHGTIMNNYANDGEFPAIRKVGLNTGFVLGKFGMELVGDNLADPSIFGSRLSLNPLSSYEDFQIGVTGIVDLFPARTVANTSDYGDPYLIGFGMDMEFLKINKDSFKLKLFTDVSTMTAIFREATNHNTIIIDPGIASDLWLDGSTLKNFGVVAGLRGSIFKFTWALEYRLSNGIYKPTLFNAVYDRNKVSYLSEIIHYLEDPSERGTVMGIYGEGGYVLKDKLAFTLGYYWPWEINSGSLSFNGEDMFSINIVFMKGLIPRFPLHGRISYERSHLIDTFRGEDDMTLFDANTVVYGELIYPIAQTLDIVIGASTVIKTDANGNTIMKSGTNTPEIAPVINIETRIHF